MNIFPPFVFSFCNQKTNNLENAVFQELYLYICTDEDIENIDREGERGRRGAPKAPPQKTFF
jgi:hypothetical protein